MRTIPAGIIASAKAASLPSDRLIRIAQVQASSATSSTLNFTEPTALDSSYLLLAFVGAWSTSNVMAASGWTELSSAGQAASSKQLRCFVKQGNSSTNGITVTSATSYAKGITLMAFAGFSSLTPLNANGANAGSSTVGIRTVTPSATPAGYGITLAAILFNPAISAWGPLSNGFLGNGTGSLTTPFMWSARHAYDAVQPSATTFDISGASTTANMSIIMPLTP